MSFLGRNPRLSPSTQVREDGEEEENDDQIMKEENTKRIRDTYIAHTNDEEQPLARALRRPNLPEAQVDPQMQGQEEAVEPGNVAAPPPTFPPPFYHFRESQLHSRKN